MIDYRLPEHRQEYFERLYVMNLAHGVMPGLVYLYLPELARRNDWDNEQRLWFAFLNGLTQNPITTLRLFERLPEVPPASATLNAFSEWFDENWDTLQFDSDRLKNKRNTVAGIKSYATLVEQFGSQAAMLAGTKSYSELWAIANQIYSFGRLSTFSYLEYVHIMGFGADCDDLMFSDKLGSRSHRNGMLFYIGKDELVWDKRLDNGQDGKYEDFNKMCFWLDKVADDRIGRLQKSYPNLKHIGRFTMESNLCTFKNHFFGRRAPGTYADMAQERIEWADARGLNYYTETFKQIRAGSLPDWLRAECQKEKLTIRQKAMMFAKTGFPHRGEYFLI